MRHVATVADIGAADAAAIAQVGEAILIDRASTAVARRAVQLLDGTYGAHVLVVAGKGHNGADALWAGVKLADRGARVDLVLPLGEPADEHGREPLRRLRARGSRLVSEPVDADLAIDGVLGIGARRSLLTPGAEWLRDLRVLAVDIPSGVDADTGAAAADAVRALATVTFGALKTGLVVGAGAEHAGLVEVAEIGLQVVLRPDDVLSVLDRDDVARLFALPRGETDKYRRGVVGVMAGSEAFPGAATLVCAGALGAGAGYVRLCAGPAVLAAVRAVHPEVVGVPRPEDGDDLPPVDSWALGPGLGTNEDGARQVWHVTGRTEPIVADADALTVMAPDPVHVRRRPAPMVLTPHTGEFARLTGVDRDAAAADRVGVTRSAATQFGQVVLLKGSTTVVAAPNGRAYVNPTGTPLLATAGTGDVLTGVIAALLCRAPALEAAAAGAWLHGLAGRLAGGDPRAPITATDVAEHLSAAVRVACGR